MEDRAVQLTKYLMWWLEEKGWRRAPFDLVSRLAVLVGDEDVEYLDATTSATPLEYEARIVLYTSTRVLLQPITHNARARGAKVDIESLSRSSLLKVTTTDSEVIAFPFWDRVLESLLPWWPRLAYWLERRCELFLDKHDWFADYYGREPAMLPRTVCVSAFYYGREEPIQLPLTSGASGFDGEQDFRDFLPKLLVDVTEGVR